MVLRLLQALVTLAFAVLSTTVCAAPPAIATLSADGTRALWPKEDGSGFLVSEKIRGAADWTPPREISVRGLVGSPVFAPNGRRVAFENPRGGYSTQEPNPWGPTRAYTWGFIAVYDFADGHIDYLNPSFAKDSNPRWLDDHTVTFTRRVEGSPDKDLTVPVEAIHASAQPANTQSAKTQLPNSASVNVSADREHLEALLRAPLVYQPTRSGDGKAIAFVAHEGRTLTIYFARQAQPARALVTYPEDDGQQLTQLAVSSDGHWVAYVRGGPPNGKDEVPNPRSVPQPPLRQIWLVKVTDTAAAQLVGAGSEPQFAPDGHELLWLSARGVARARLREEGTRAGSLGTVQYVLPGPTESLRFSPDGSRISYQRSSHIEVFDFATKATWAVPKPSEATDSDAAWSADGHHLAFRREYGHQPDTQTGFAEHFVAKQPWTIWVADPIAHEARQVWRAERGLGSAYYNLDQDATDAGSLGDQLLWSSDNHIAFAWERDGWRHLYAVSVEGGPARLLTPGKGEVEAASVSLDGSAIIYATNIGDLERRHIHMVSFTGAAPTEVTGGMTSQWAPTPAASGGLAYIEAGWAKPPAVVWEDSARRVTAAGPVPREPFPVDKVVQPQPVSFHGTDGGTAHGQLFVPTAPKGCGVVFVHGGIKRQMLLGFHYMDAYSNLYEVNQYLASRGCAVLSVEYRSSIMRGYDFRNAPGWGTAGASEYKDVLGGANYLKSRADLHVANVGIYGLSWGGYLTAQALARNSDVFKVGFDVAGVHSFPGASFKYSPVAFAEQWSSPVYLAAGDDDRNVDFNQTILLIQALHDNPHKVEIVEKVYPNETHAMSLTFQHLTDLYWEGTEFLLHHLLQ